MRGKLRFHKLRAEGGVWLKPKAEPVLVAATCQTCSAHLGSLGGGPVAALWRD